MARLARDETLFWIVRRQAGALSVWLQPATAATFALLRSAIAGHAGELHDLRQLPRALARQVPADLVARPLSPRQAGRLVDRLAARQKKAAAPRGTAAKAGRLGERKMVRNATDTLARPRGR